jgi:hypothetical protein
MQKDKAEDCFKRYILIFSGIVFAMTAFFYQKYNTPRPNFLDENLVTPLKRGNAIRLSGTPLFSGKI